MSLDPYTIKRTTVMLFNLCFGGFVMRCMWQWFFVEVFGLMQLHTTTFIGFLLCRDMKILICGEQETQPPSPREERVRLLHVSVNLVLYLVIAFIVHLFQ